MTTNPTFQRRHYEAIASMVRTLRKTYTLGALEPHFDAKQVDFMAREFAFALRADNARFDRARFLRACGVEE